MKVKCVLAAGIVLAGCGNEEAAEEPTEPVVEEQKNVEEEETVVKEPEKELTYNVTFERYDDSGMYYLDIDTNATNEEEIEEVLNKVISETKDKQEGEVNSSFVQVYNGDSVVANTKIAFGDRGMAQTGLTKENDWNIEMR